MSSKQQSTSNSSLCSASSSYLKQPGNLSLNERALTWSNVVATTKSIANSNDLLIATSKMSGKVNILYIYSIK